MDMKDVDISDTMSVRSRMSKISKARKRRLTTKPNKFMLPFWDPDETPKPVESTPIEYKDNLDEHIFDRLRAGAENRKKAKVQHKKMRKISA